MVTAVGVCPAGTGALAKAALAPRTLQVVQEDVSRARAQVGLSRGSDGPTAPQLPAYDPGFVQVPQVVTHSAPGSLVQDFHMSRAPFRTAHHLQLWLIFQTKQDFTFEFR